LLPCAALAQNNADKFPYPGDTAAPTQPGPPAPLIVPKGTLQPNAHTAEIKVFDPPCLDPTDGSNYGYDLQRGAPDRTTEIQEYVWNMHKPVYDHWLLGWPRMAGRPWLKKGIVGVKFTIEKDGTIDIPFVTLSSPHDGFDEHAVKSLEEMSPLSPLPAGTKVLRMCLFFRYNIENPPERHKPNYDSWQDAPGK
jgi:TonB family protein